MTYQAASAVHSSSVGGLVAAAGVQAVVDWVQPGSSGAVPLAGHWRMELHSAALGRSSPVPRFPRMTTRMRTTNWRIVVSSLCRSARVPVRHLVRPGWLSLVWSSSQVGQQQEQKGFGLPSGCPEVVRQFACVVHLSLLRLSEWHPGQCIENLSGCYG